VQLREERDAARAEAKQLDNRLQGYVENSQQRSVQFQQDVSKAHEYNTMLQDKVGSARVGYYALPVTTLCNKI
jgi:hypothetical protein